MTSDPATDAPGLSGAPPSPVAGEVLKWVRGNLDNWWTEAGCRVAETSVALGEALRLLEHCDLCYSPEYNHVLYRRARCDFFRLADRHATRHAERVINALENLGDTRLQADCVLLRAQIAQSNGNLKLALTLFAEAERLYQPLPVPDIRRALWREMAVLYVRLGNLNAATTYLDRLRPSLGELSLGQKRCLLLNLHSLLANEDADHEDCQPCYQAVLTCAERAGDRWSEAMAHLALAQSALVLGKDEAAHEHLETARPVFVRMEAEHLVGFCFILESQVAVRQRRYEHAHHVLVEGKQRLLSHEDREKVVYAQVIYGEFLADRQSPYFDPTCGQVVLEEALYEARHLALPWLERKALSALSRVSEMRGLDQQAEEYLTEAHALGQSLEHLTRLFQDLRA